MWPNPAQNGTLVQVKGEQGATVQVRDARGQLVAGAVVEADGTAVLLLAHLATGLYLVQCGSQSTRLVLEK